MKANHQNFKGKKGRSGRKGHGEEQAYLKALDKAIPKAVEFCELLINEAIAVREEFEKVDQTNPASLKAYWDEFKMKNDLGAKAAHTLISKAPQRIQGNGNGGAIVMEIKDSQYARIVQRESAKIVARTRGATETGGS